MSRFARLVSRRIDGDVCGCFRSVSIIVRGVLDGTDLRSTLRCVRRDGQRLNTRRATAGGHGTVGLTIVELAIVVKVEEVLNVVSPAVIVGYSERYVLAR
ncbi:hypothetical protein HPS36_09795 [Halorubrum salinarum]|uniref:Uncharacterized protein n=1 Tax=Halorubrum salinarum TaxID=2739057 RepID=A0A7D4CM10_9EURY|nr:hypothetical protein [Halorubrum salinarum]QKG93141.1 hypothetical protein HPS36_09795 [Halorubrum salinarum]